MKALFESLGAVCALLSSSGATWAPGVLDMFEALVEGADRTSLGWILFAFVSFLILSFVLTLQKTQRVSTINKMIGYAVMFVALTFVFVMVAVRKAAEADALAENIGLMVFTAGVIAVLVVRWLGQQENRDKILGATVFSIAYFSCFGLFGRMKLAYGSGVLMGVFYGFVIGALVFSWRSLQKKGILDKKADVAPSGSEQKKNPWKRARKM